MNLALIQRPKKVKARGKQPYIYAPSVLMEGFSLKAESIIHILDVHEGPTPEETTLKVMENSVWQAHIDRWRGGIEGCCTLVKEQLGHYKNEGQRPECGCEKDLDEMPDDLRAGTHFVLLSDIGK